MIGRQSVKVLEEVLRSDAEREGLDDGWSEGSEK